MNNSVLSDQIGSALSRPFVTNAAIIFAFLVVCLVVVSLMSAAIRKKGGDDIFEPARIALWSLLGVLGSVSTLSMGFTSEHASEIDTVLQAGNFTVQSARLDTSGNLETCSIVAKPMTKTVVILGKSVPGVTAQAECTITGPELTVITPVLQKVQIVAIQQGIGEVASN